MGEIVRWTDAPRGMLINPKGEWCSYADVISVVADHEQRNRELTRQVEQLQAECDWMRRNAPLAYSQYKALAAPPSSSDPGRADTEK